MKHRIDENGFYLDSYTLDYPYFQEDWTLTEVPLTGSFIKRKLVDNVWVEGATPEEIHQLQIGTAKSNETEAYKKRTQDGINAYAEISAEFRLAKLNGIISEETQRYVERALIPVRNEVLAGQWISAKNELELLGIESIGVDLYNRLHNQISDYINLNY